MTVRTVGASGLYLLPGPYSAWSFGGSLTDYGFIRGRQAWVRTGNNIVSDVYMNYDGRLIYTPRTTATTVQSWAFSGLAVTGTADSITFTFQNVPSTHGAYNTTFTLMQGVVNPSNWGLTFLQPQFNVTYPATSAQMSSWNTLFNTAVTALVPAQGSIANLANGVALRWYIQRPEGRAFNITEAPVLYDYAINNTYAAIVTACDNAGDSRNNVAHGSGYPRTQMSITRLGPGAGNFNLQTASGYESSAGVFSLLNATYLVPQTGGGAFIANKIILENTLPRKNIGRVAVSHAFFAVDPGWEPERFSILFKIQYNSSDTVAAGRTNYLLIGSPRIFTTGARTLDISTLTAGDQYPMWTGSFNNNFAIYNVPLSISVSNYTRTNQSLILAKVPSTVPWVMELADQFTLSPGEYNVSHNLGYMTIPASVTSSTNQAQYKIYNPSALWNLSDNVVAKYIFLTGAAQPPLPPDPSLPTYTLTFTPPSGGTVTIPCDSTDAYSTITSAINLSTDGTLASGVTITNVVWELYDPTGVTSGPISQPSTLTAVDDYNQTLTVYPTNPSEYCKEIVFVGVRATLTGSNGETTVTDNVFSTKICMEGAPDLEIIHTPQDFLAEPWSVNFDNHVVWAPLVYAQSGTTDLTNEHINWEVVDTNAPNGDVTLIYTDDTYDDEGTQIFYPVYQVGVRAAVNYPTTFGDGIVVTWVDLKCTWDSACGTVSTVVRLVVNAQFSAAPPIIIPTIECLPQTVNWGANATGLAEHTWSPRPTLVDVPAEVVGITWYLQDTSTVPSGLTRVPLITATGLNSLTADIWVQYNIPAVGTSLQTSFVICAGILYDSGLFVEVTHRCQLNVNVQNLPRLIWTTQYVTLPYDYVGGSTNVTFSPNPYLDPTQPSSVTVNWSVGASNAAGTVTVTPNSDGSITLVVPAQVSPSWGASSTTWADITATISSAQGSIQVTERVQVVVARGNPTPLTSPTIVCSVQNVSLPNTVSGNYNYTFTPNPTITGLPTTPVVTAIAWTVGTSVPVGLANIPSLVPIGGAAATSAQLSVVVAGVAPGQTRQITFPLTATVTVADGRTIQAQHMCVLNLVTAAEPPTPTVNCRSTSPNYTIECIGTSQRKITLAPGYCPDYIVTIPELYTIPLNWPTSRSYARNLNLRIFNFTPLDPNGTSANWLLRPQIEVGRDSDADIVLGPEYTDINASGVGTFTERAITKPGNVLVESTQIGFGIRLTLRVPPAAGTYTSSYSWILSGEVASTATGQLLPLMLTGTTTIILVTSSDCGGCADGRLDTLVTPDVFHCWPFNVNWREVVTETLTFATDIMSADNRGEQRMALRSLPRRYLQFTSSFMSQQETDLLKNWLQLNQAGQDSREIFVPLWNQAENVDITISGNIPGSNNYRYVYINADHETLESRIRPLLRLYENSPWPVGGAYIEERYFLLWVNFRLVRIIRVDFASVLGEEGIPWLHAEFFHSDPMGAYDKADPIMFNGGGGDSPTRIKLVPLAKGRLDGMFSLQYLNNEVSENRSVKFKINDTEFYNRDGRQYLPGEFPHCGDLQPFNRMRGNLQQIPWYPYKSQVIDGEYYGDGYVVDVMNRVDLRQDETGDIDRPIVTAEFTQGTWEDVETKGSWSGEDSRFTTVFKYEPGDYAPNYDNFPRTIRETFLWANGRLRSFWIASGTRDFRHAYVTGEDSCFVDTGVKARLAAVGGDYTKLPPIYVRYRLRPHFIVRIVGLTSLTNGIENIVFEGGVVIENDPSDVPIISWMQNVRFTNDSLDFQYLTDNAGMCSFGLTEVKDSLNDLVYDKGNCSPRFRALCSNITLWYNPENIHPEPPPRPPGPIPGLPLKAECFNITEEVPWVEPDPPGTVVNCAGEVTLRLGSDIQPGGTFSETLCFNILSPPTTPFTNWAFTATILDSSSFSSATLGSPGTTQQCATVTGVAPSNANTSASYCLKVKITITYDGPTSGGGTTSHSMDFERSCCVKILGTIPMPCDPCDPDGECYDYDECNNPDPDVDICANLMCTGMQSLAPQNSKTLYIELNTQCSYGYTVPTYPGDMGVLSTAWSIAGHTFNTATINTSETALGWVAIDVTFVAANEQYPTREYQVSVACVVTTTSGAIITGTTTCIFTSYFGSGSIPLEVICAGYPGAGWSVDVPIAASIVLESEQHSRVILPHGTAIGSTQTITLPPLHMAGAPLEAAATYVVEYLGDTTFGTVSLNNNTATPVVVTYAAPAPSDGVVEYSAYVVGTATWADATGNTVTAVSGCTIALEVVNWPPDPVEWTPELTVEPTYKNYGSDAPTTDTLTVGPVALSTPPDGITVTNITWNYVTYSIDSVTLAVTSGPDLTNTATVGFTLPPSGYSKVYKLGIGVTIDYTDTNLGIGLNKDTSIDMLLIVSNNGPIEEET